MATHESVDAEVQLERLKTGIRDLAHDISNPLGVLRMAAYYLEHGNPEKEKQSHYYAMITQTVDKVEAGLKKLRALGDNPMLDVRGGPDSEGGKK